MSELKPCPFCGCTAIYETRTHYYDDEDTAAIFCNGCKSVVVLERNEAEGINDETRKSAREAWNTRAPYEMDGFFYLPKPKEPLLDYTDRIYFDEQDMKVKASVDIAAKVDAIYKWQQEQLNRHIIERICEVFKPERTCHNTQNDFDFMCSNCGKMLDNGRVIGVNYCPKCGAKVVDE